jgi:NADPH-dependent 2,4-dienoyl-CoA reductase/sulfur reductase-like enzyme/ferredoxin
VIAFFTEQETAVMALAVAASAGSFLALEALLPMSTPKLAALYAATAINLFYWWAAPGPDWVAWPLRAVVLALTVLWLRNTFIKERVFLERQGLPTPPRAARLGRAMRTALKPAAEIEVTFEEGPRIVARPGTPLLELAETAEQPIEAGCRMGVCGADPVQIVSGMEGLSPVGSDEQATLERLGLDPAHNRMACCARVEGPVTVSMTPRRDSNVVVSIDFPYDPEVRRIVVLGNGIAGVTAADHVRRRHPDCTVDVVAAEPHPLYNRMGISRLIYGRSAMVGLHLLPDAWYDDNRITCWLNTRAQAIDREAGEVLLGTGERLPYDRLILATGSEAHVPEIPGFGGPGSFALRTASDALGVREFVQQAHAERALVAGGGLLGLEAAYALHKLGLRTTVLERGRWLLRRQLDERAGNLLRGYLANLGIEVLIETQVAAVDDGHAVLTDGSRLPTDVLLVAAGIEPAVELAREAGLATARGVLVDDQLRTSDERIFAAGDAAEWQEGILGLWPVAVDQAEVAAENAVGGARAYTGTVPQTMLKVVGVELFSIGAITGPNERVDEDADALRYRKLVADETGRVIGAILLGHPEQVPAVTAAVRRSLPLAEVA